ncbi:TniQ domain containing protein [Pyrenophora tritici-repentis]|uniref:TniQ domain containing protein n=2 Tax=Pyrenophora tritici-repentis TaxID=45151 RepID=A0A2W1GJ09_9PLEO|nr:uncharacterized protein PTRG_03033 [Pyrenophora tritici-repentis Pt-1C-BFP]KAA8622884.1 hypothetical protein PtrV1_04190 [Pyrenophora tritici-repentis]EDU45556.1 predicted protein [Pyrenophora tritici-repentis Pt-1C-BFP]KAF7451874.1 hypothetical protein A1F99_036510 [Pyrenophora tritici-repentis]KAF7575003.1 TniQ domain containing protein [Pyrenophora tritici-repentis]KAG9386232.1 hypothetical protein A1F94_002982 [Pyrenophora tritici-repentis]
MPTIIASFGVNIAVAILYLMVIGIGLDYALPAVFSNANVIIPIFMGTVCVAINYYTQLAASSTLATAVSDIRVDNKDARNLFIRLKSELDMLRFNHTELLDYCEELQDENAILAEKILIFQGRVRRG